MFLTPLPDLFGTTLFHNAARMTLLVVSASIAPNETTKVVNPPRGPITNILPPIHTHRRPDDVLLAQGCGESTGSIAPDDGLRTV